MSACFLFFDRISFNRFWLIARPLFCHFKAAPWRLVCKCCGATIATPSPSQETQNSSLTGAARRQRFFGSQHQLPQRFPLPIVATGSNFFAQLVQAHHKCQTDADDILGKAILMFTNTCVNLESGLELKATLSENCFWYKPRLSIMPFGDDAVKNEIMGKCIWLAPAAQYFFFLFDSTPPPIFSANGFLCHE